MDRQRRSVCDVFISYAGFDRNLAARLATSLEAANVSMWWDAHLSWDQPFEQQIQRILADTKVIVAILSSQALASEWVRWELSQASQNGLHIVPLLVGGVRAEHLPPPLHLHPSLTIPDNDNGNSMHGVAMQIRGLVETINRRPNEHRENDARRRLASAASRTARQATDIRYRKTETGPRPPIVVSGFEHRGDQKEAATRYSMSDGLVSFLQDENIAIAFTSFQTGELYLLGRTSAGELTVNVQAFRKPTGLYVAADMILVATLAHLYRLTNILAHGQQLDGTYSHCFLPRAGYFTGVLETHDVGLTGDGEPVFIATRYNCLATTSQVHSFKPVWRPFFVSDIVAEDRCHLNGLAMSDGVPAYVTAIGASNNYDAWRDHVANGGIVLDVKKNAIVCDGLSMPHSPRVRNNRLWLLNSGVGELGYIDREPSGHRVFQSIAFCPGFVRGLAFHRHYAFVGLSRPRYDDFAGLDLNDRLRDAHEVARCGIEVIDTASGQRIHWFYMDGPARELYDVAVLPGVSCPRSFSCLDDEGFELVTMEVGNPAKLKIIPDGS